MKAQKQYVNVKAGKLTYKAEVMRSFSKKIQGLMFSEPKNIIMVFKKEGIYGIHSFFVFFPFDAIWLDSNKRVVNIARAVRPFTLYVENTKPAKYLLELCERNNIKVGDKLEWSD